MIIRQHRKRWSWDSGGKKMPGPGGPGGPFGRFMTEEEKAERKTKEDFQMYR